MKPRLLFNSNGLVIWHDFPVIKHNKVKSDRRSAIFNFIKLTFFTVYSYLKPHILFNSNGPAIWRGFPVITDIQVKNILKSKTITSPPFKILSR